MPSRSRKPEYVYAFYLTLIVLFSTGLDLVTGDKHGGLPFHLSLVVFGTMNGLIAYISVNYNKRNSVSPIRLWMRTCFGATIALFLCICLIVFGAESLNIFLFFLLGAFLMARTGFLYVNDRLRLQPRFYD
jgi:hypothetical protein